MVSKKISPLKHVRIGKKNQTLGISVRCHSASFVMPISDPRDAFFYPTLIIEYYIGIHVLLLYHFKGYLTPGLYDILDYTLIL